MATKKKGRLYRGGAKRRVERKFERRYGKKRGDYIYGAVVGKVKREQAWLAQHGATMVGYANARIGTRKVRGQAGRATVRHTHAHSDPHHHVGLCSAADRRGKESHGHALKRDAKGRWY